MFVPHQAGKFGQGLVAFKTLNIAHFSQDTGRVNRADPLDGIQSLRKGFQVFCNQLVQLFSSDCMALITLILAAREAFTGSARALLRR